MLSNKEVKDLCVYHHQDLIDLVNSIDEGPYAEDVVQQLYLELLTDVGDAEDLTKKIIEIIESNVW
jgi:hypothetical protein|tara:strand:+ start:856 stop:1053 length:198 start_codon:yes stop_codon:yes gene_type:complete